jgi:hypothetical protein
MTIKAERIYKYGSTLCKDCGVLVALREDLEPVRHGKRKWKPEGCPGGNRPARKPDGGVDLGIGDGQRT